MTTVRKASAERHTYADYEQAKREWSDANPRATPAEYQAAMVRIAARMRV